MDKQQKKSTQDTAGRENPIKSDKDFDTTLKALMSVPTDKAKKPKDDKPKTD